MKFSLSCLSSKRLYSFTTPHKVPKLVSHSHRAQLWIKDPKSLNKQTHNQINSRVQRETNLQLVPYSLNTGFALLRIHSQNNRVPHLSRNFNNLDRRAPRPSNHIWFSSSMAPRLYLYHYLHYLRSTTLNLWLTSNLLKYTLNTSSLQSLLFFRKVISPSETYNATKLFTSTLI